MFKDKIRSVLVIKKDLVRTRASHDKLNAEIDALQRRQGLGNSMELQRMKNTREGHKRRKVELEAELVVAESKVPFEIPKPAEGQIEAALITVSG